MSKTITVAKGDGIGPEIMEATLKILYAAKADIKVEEITVGKNVYESLIESSYHNSAGRRL